MPIKFSNNKTILTLASLVVFLLAIWLFSPSPAQAGCCNCGNIVTNPNFCIKNVENCDTCAEAQKMYDPNCNLCRPNSCCVKVLKQDNKIEQCVPNRFQEECEEVKPFTTTIGHYFNTSCSAVADCKRIGEVYSGDKSNTEPRVVKPLKFVPNITIPGSITIGGKKYEFIAGKEVIIDNMTIGLWISVFYQFFCWSAGILAAVMIMYGGYKYIVSFGNASRMSDAKNTIYSALFGLVLALGAYVILYTINPNLVKFESLDIRPIETILLGEGGTGSEKGATAVAWDGKNTCQYDKILDQAANANIGIDRKWLKALMLIESGGNPQAESKDKDGKPLACGLMQLLPGTAKDTCKKMNNPPTNCDNINCEILKTPEINIPIAARYYSDLMTNTCPLQATYRNGETVKCDPTKTKCENGVPLYANAAYNAGWGANCSSIDCTGMTWWECPSNEGFDETRTYVQKAQDAYNKITTDPNFNWNIDCKQ